MTQLPTKGPVIRVKPQDNLYTMLLVVAGLVLLISILIVANRLISSGGYGLEFSQLFKGLE